MNLSKMSCILIVVVAVAAISSTNAWAETAYMRVEGSTQGPIEGSVISPHGYENWIAVGSFGHNLKVPVDPRSGSPTGTRMHGPIRVVIPFDKSAPQLYSALVTGELLTEVEIQFLRVNETGLQEHFFTILLQDAVIISMSPSLVPSSEQSRMMTIVSFSYRRITWTDVIDSKTFQDDWRVEG